MLRRKSSCKHFHVCIHLQPSYRNGKISHLYEHLRERNKNYVIHRDTNKNISSGGPSQPKLGGCSDIFLVKRRNFTIFWGPVRKFPDFVEQKKEIFEDWGGCRTPDTPPVGPPLRYALCSLSI
jgi:hypothetical protein